MCLKRKLDREELKVLHLEVSDSIGYILSIQSCTALRCCYQAASVMEPLKANTTEMANIIEAGRSLCHFENPSVQIPIFLLATSMFWNPKVIFHLLLLLLLPLSLSSLLHRNSTSGLVFKGAKLMLLSPQTSIHSQAAFQLHLKKKTTTTISQIKIPQILGR